MSDSREYRPDDVVFSHRCVDYLNMSPEIPIGDLSEPHWRMRSTREFTERCREELRDANSQCSPLELNAAISATIDHVYADTKDAPEEVAALRIKFALGMTKIFFNHMVARAENDDTIHNDEQFYIGSCLRASAGFIYSDSGNKLTDLRQRIRRNTVTRLVRLDQRINTELAEQDDRKLGRLFVVRAELLTAAALMRKDHDYRQPEEIPLVLPALTRQAYSFAQTPVDHRWGTSVWRLDSEAALHTGLNLATPPDAKLSVKQGRLKNDHRAQHDPSITYVSLLDDVIHAEESNVSGIVESLRSEFRTSRATLPPTARDELDFVTRNARAVAGLDA